MTDEISRREFVKQAAAGAALLAGVSGGVLAGAEVTADPNKRIVAALGAVFIPSKTGDPGYADLESHGISDFVMQKLPAALLDTFNAGAQPYFDGRSFLDLNDDQRGQYVALVADGSKLTDPKQKALLQSFYRAARTRIMTVYYGNFPLEDYKPDAQGVPLTQPGDTHQVTNPDVWKPKNLVTGWNIAGYKGQPGWTEEVELRDKQKKTSLNWVDRPTVVLDSSRPSPAAAGKTSDGHDYYDVIVLGGGTAGCIVAGRLAERGMNPKTGDRLRVALIEGGDDWTVRDPSINPGYGAPVRRLMSVTPDTHYDYPLAEGEANMKRLGGCVLHYGGTLWLPQEEDFQFYRDTSGVNWDIGKFESSIQEVSDLMYVARTPDEFWSKGDHMWADGARALGFEVHSNQRAFRNGFPGSVNGENENRFDCKGNTLPWAYIGINHGLKIIANAEVDKILIEKTPGKKPVAIGAVYKDKTGAMREVRAARVIISANVVWAPLICYRSGYGPKDVVGDKLIVENKNVGENLTGDCSYVSSALLSEPVNFIGRNAQISSETAWASTSPRPHKVLDIRFYTGSPSTNPRTVATNTFAPQFGWEHKDFMRNEAGISRIMTWRCHFCAIPWTWKIQPDALAVRTSIDLPAFNAAIKQAEEWVRAWHEKLPVKVLQADLRTFSRDTNNSNVVRAMHMTGTTRAGADPGTSVCNSDFDCHDIDHLMFTSGSALPKTILWSAGPTAVSACYAYRRMIENHFSTGCSTKGFA
jgi:choline dehydrogenase-like flavoprotein